MSYVKTRTRIMGFDPGLRKTGWGIIDVEGAKLIHVANGVVKTDSDNSLAERLVQLHDGLTQVIIDYEPNAAAVEETFVNKNPNSTLKLGQARGISLLVASLAGMNVGEYSPNHIKKSVVGAGHAGKEQVQAMLAVLLPKAKVNGEDAADALAVAICHAHHGAAHGSLHKKLRAVDGVKKKGKASYLDNIKNARIKSRSTQNKTKNTGIITKNKEAGAQILIKGTR